MTRDRAFMGPRFVKLLRVPKQEARTAQERLTCRTELRRAAQQCSAATNSPTRAPARRMGRRREDRRRECALLIARPPCVHASLQMEDQLNGGGYGGGRGGFGMDKVIAKILQPLREAPSCRGMFTGRPRIIHDALFHRRLPRRSSQRGSWHRPQKVCI